MLMEHHHHHTQARPGWTPSLYPTATVTSSVSLPFNSLLSFAYSSVDSQHQSPQNQDNKWPSHPNEAGSRTLPPPPDEMVSSLFRPMLDGSVSLNHKIRDKSSSKSAIVIHAKRATDEKRRAKHREAQRRFVNRKKVRTDGPPSLFIRASGWVVDADRRLLDHESDQNDATKAIGGRAGKTTLSIAGSQRTRDVGTR